MPTATETDVLVIGAGPTGAAAAWRLASAGLRVTVVERGGWFDYDALDREGPGWELARATRYSSNPNIRQGPDDEPVEDAETPIKPMLGNAVGGSSIYWSAHVPRFRPEDFCVRSLDGVGADWPIAYEDLAPYYALNERQLGVASAPGNPAAAPHGEAALMLPTIGAHGRRFAREFDRRGWHWWPVDLVVGRDADRPDTTHCSHVGPCDLGCPSRIRSGADRAYMQDAVAAGARLFTHTRVQALEQDGRGEVVAAVCANEHGVFRLSAARFFLAANGMGTARLLLLSASAHAPNGLGNRAGLVGRGLMLHPYARIDGWFDGPLGGWVCGEKAGIVSFEFSQTVRARGFVRGVKLQLVTGPGPVALAEGAIVGAPLPWGAEHHRAFEARFDRFCGFTVCAEDLPEEHNRIALSERLKDRDGLPAPKMIYRVAENSRRALDFGLDRAGEVLNGAGARQLFRTPLRDQAGFHIMGTARMGADPETSVVDPFCRLHEAPNVYVADASAFVTSSAANPTATAQALALRAADHAVRTRRE